MKKHLIIIVNEDSFFLSHRLRVAEMAKENGWDVTVVSKNTGQSLKIIERGLKFNPLPINPTGLKLSQEIKLLFFLIKLFKGSPDHIIHLVGLKNMLWGGIASKIAKPKGMVFAISGLGTLFGEKKSSILSSAIQKVLKFGMKGKNHAVIFQNQDDRDLFEKAHICDTSRSFHIKGSGVNLVDYRSDPHKEDRLIKIIFTGRMIKEKGVEDLISAAQLLRPKYEGKIQFILCGDIINHPDSFSRQQLASMCYGDYIKWLGYREDIPDLLADADIMCFPSYYREGVPKSLLEASAASLPIVTTDSVGCRDTVEEGKNGFIVPPHSPSHIAEALEKLILDADLRKKMGAYSRGKAEKEYDVENVARIHLNIYNSLLGLE